MSRLALRASALLTCAALTAGLAGCTSGGDPSASTSSEATVSMDPGSSTASAPPSPTTTQSSTPEAEAATAAEETLRRYFTITDSILADPNVPLVDSLLTVAAEDELDVQRQRLSNQRRRGLQQIGATVMTSVAPTSIALENQPEAQPPVYPSVVLESCIDVSGVNVVDATGQSVVTADRPSQQLVTATVKLYPYLNGWAVAAMVVKGDPCASA